jgi:hypothetical protein
MWRIVVLAGLAGCGLALAGPGVNDQRSDDQPRSLDDLAHGMRFQLTTTPLWKAPMPPPLQPPPLQPPPSIGFSLTLQLDSTWPGRRLRLSPHFPISREFENGGDSWAALCDRRGVADSRDAREVLSYLTSWCDFSTSKLALDEFVPLVSAHAKGLATAVRDDVADILADDRPWGQAVTWLDRNHIKTMAMLDALAASYAASDQLDDARHVLEYERDHDPFPSPAIACRRLQHEAAVSDPTRRDKIEGELLATPANDPTCARIAAPLRCKLELASRVGIASCGAHDLERVVAADLSRCAPYLKQSPESTSAVALLALRAHWPKSTVGSCHWQDIGRAASASLSIPGAEPFALTALENGVVDSECDATTRASISRIAGTIRRDKAHAKSLDARVAELASMDEGHCKTFRR